MKPTEVVYTVLSVAAFAALSVILWVSLNPPAFSLGGALSGSWSKTSANCAELQFPATVAFDFAGGSGDDVFESLQLEPSAPLLSFGPVSMNMSRAPCDRRWIGAASWSYVDACVAPAGAHCALTLRNGEVVLWVTTQSAFCSVHWVKNERVDPFDRKMVSAGLIVVIVIGMHTVLSRFRPSSRSLKLEEKYRRLQHRQAVRTTG
jgi:hypothetical protein